MKKIILISLFIFINNLWATTFDFVWIEIPQDKWSDWYIGMERDDSDLEKKCKNYMENRPHTDVFGGCSESICPSFLDSLIAFGQDDWCYYLYEDCFRYAFYLLPGATHSLLDVIKDEFSQMRECQYLNFTDDELEDMIHGLETDYFPLSEESRDPVIFIYEEGQFKAVSYNCGTGGCLLPAETYINDYLKDLGLPPEFIPYRMDFAARLRAENGFLIVPADLEGQAFSIFSLNGRVLRKGELRNNMPLPHEPAVLRVKGYGDMYLK